MMDGREVHELGDESAAYEMPGRGQNDPVELAAGHGVGEISAICSSREDAVYR